ncbi:hypothetical protein [Bradyrhizobium sp. CER78]|uniref:hypothetical protein n=1 Tax=Bradyrhizobium sp. CER78 TaxID=3039162 RepID=UPI0024493378|nr:hypothetical protein [Bradyrhizobium sp. CER78]MDH2380062.1 hypothetical protein [Bradyrhizobium sp. CER78]
MKRRIMRRCLPELLASASILQNLWWLCTASGNLWWMVPLPFSGCKHHLFNKPNKLIEDTEGHEALSPEIIGSHHHQPEFPAVRRSFRPKMPLLCYGSKRDLFNLPKKLFETAARRLQRPLVVDL